MSVAADSSLVTTSEDVHAQTAANDSDLDVQRSFWNGWNADTREKGLEAPSLRQREIVLEWLAKFTQPEKRPILEIGCGAGWLLPDLKRYGVVTATDLVDEVVSRAQERHPDIHFASGDFMGVDFGGRKFNIIVCLDVLSYVAEQEAFVAKIASLLAPGGLLMLATENRPVLERWNKVPPAQPGNRRHWCSASELKELLATRLQVLQLFSVSPIANRGIMGLVNSPWLNRSIRSIVGDRLERWKEQMGWGWTLMALARKPYAVAQV